MPGRPEPPSLNTSLNHFDKRPMTWRLGERRVAGDERRIERLREGHVHGVVRRDVRAQHPRTSQEIDVRVSVKIEVGKVRDCLRRPATRQLAGPYETTQTLRDFNIGKMRQMELVLVAIKTGLDPNATRSLQQKFEQR